nr:testis-expressed protein 47-like [Dromaius novaehollandiae]
MSGAHPPRGRRDSPVLAAPERRSLLAARLERLHASLAPLCPQSRFPLHRLVVVARRGEGAEAAAVAGYHRRLFENALKCHSGEQVSGLLLLYSSCVLHVIESCIGTIHLIIQDLASLQNQGHNALLQEIKVLVVSHNIPTRLFPDWYVTTVTPPVTYLQDATQSQSTAEVVTECLTLLFKLAAYVPKMLEDDSDDLSNNLHTLAPELLIPAETINYLCNIEECASPEEFLKMYLNPLQPAMDSGTLPTILGTKVNLRHRTRILAHNIEFRAAGFVTMLV